MPQVIRQERMATTEYSTSGSVLSSAIFHALLFTLVTVGLPFVSKDPLVISTPINVEIVDIADVTQTTNAAPPRKEKKEKTPEPAAEKPVPKTMTAEAPPDLLAPAPPDIEEPEEIVPEPPKEVKKKPDPPPVAPKKPKVKPKPPKKKEQKDNSFDTLLKNLMPDEGAEESDEKALDPDQKNSSQISQMGQLGEKMTISELDAIKQQIYPCWIVPAGAKYAEDLRIEVRAHLRPDGTVLRTNVLDTATYNRDAYFRSAADAAERALLNPRCQPLKLPANKYEQWKTIVIVFDPSEML